MCSIHLDFMRASLFSASFHALLHFYWSLLNFTIFNIKCDPCGKRTNKFPDTYADKFHWGDFCDHNDRENCECNNAERNCPTIKDFYIVQGSQYIVSADIEGCHRRSRYEDDCVITTCAQGAIHGLKTEDGKKNFGADQANKSKKERKNPEDKNCPPR